MSMPAKPGRRKAQVSAEAVVIFAFVLLIFMFVSFSAVTKQRDSEEIRKNMEMRAECIRLSNILSSVYSGGNGTSVNAETSFYLTMPGNGSIMLARSVNITEELPEQRIAILASEVGPTSQTFFNNMSEKIDPDWYKVCFSDIGSGSGCQQWGLGMNVTAWNSISWTLSSLMKNLTERPDYYTTIYLEDPHIQYNAQYDGRPYIDILSDWVSRGNVLIMSEHVRCREQGSGSYLSTSYRCNPSGWNQDVWTFLGVRLNQEGSPGSATIVNESDYFGFSIGQQMTMEERNYMDNAGAPQFFILAKYVAGGSDYNNKPAIISWKQGDGMAYYFADFQVTAGMTQEQYTSRLSQIIETAYYVLHFTSSAEICSVPVKTMSYMNLHGRMRFYNSEGRVMVADLEG